MTTMTIAQAVWPRPAHRAAALSRDALLALAFSLLTALSAQISIHLPFTPVPITGQTFGVLLTGALLGPRVGAVAMALYLIEGIVGLPVFAPSPHGHTSTAALISPSGGYLWSYPLAAGLVGWLAERGWDRKPARMLAAMALGSFIIYTLGVLQLSLFPPFRIGAHAAPGQGMGLGEACVEGMLPFLIGDAVKALLAAGLLPMGWKLLGAKR